MVAIRLGGKPKAIGSDDCPSVDDTASADLDPMI